ncbi:MFS transporter [Acaricomes phytoseiuli]|uniref:MFS transporter n=1 Tax=Acaricomes phytoseiuli TaxID=291968 RepID=UPI0003609A3C|nr:MFS transporter [Acaricomes phytoseiuli]MCW1250555.1 MFS transporter [Acaricomes phytoseiuli]
MKRRRATLTGVALGNGIEFYDWAIYATTAPFFASQVFRSGHPVADILGVLAVFAVGFFARPFGGLLFGWIADRRGRRTAMTASIGLASLGSLMIALTPTFAAAGILAPVLLLIARVFQGLAHGGEMPAAQTYLAEYAPRRRRGLYSSLIYISVTSGVLAGTILGAVLSSSLPATAMDEWGWRIPFAVGAALGLVTLFIRRYMAETETFTQAQAAQTDRSAEPARQRLWPQILQHRRRALQVVGMVSGLTVSYYVWAVSAPAYAVSLGMDRGAALWASVIGNLVFMAALPLWGALSDRIGRKPVMLAGSLGVLVMIFPMNSLLGPQPWTLAVGMSAVLVFMAANSSIMPTVMAELFPTGIRTIGVAVPYSIAIALFGGTAPYLQTWLTELSGSAALFSGYAIVLTLVSIVTVLTLPETRAKELNDSRPTRF